MTLPLIDLTVVSEDEAINEMLSLMEELCHHGQDRSTIHAELLALSVVVVVGLIGNGFVAFVVAMLHDISISRPAWMLIQMTISNVVFLCFTILSIVEEYTNKWSMGLAACKWNKYLSTVVLSHAIVLLTITNLERTLTYIGGTLPYRLASMCSERVRRILCIVAMWTLCLGVSVPQFKYAEIDLCNRCSMIHPLTDEDVCEYLKLNKITCTNFFSFQHNLSLVQKDVTWDHYYTDYHDNGSDYNAMRPPDANYLDKQFAEFDKLFNNNRSNETEFKLPCQHDEPSHFYRILYMHFVLFFVVPLLSMLASATAMHVRKARTRFSPIQADTSSQWTTTVLSLNILFLLCWVPFHAVSLSRVRGLQVQPSTCEALNQYSQFSAVCYYAFLPYVYMFMTRNCRHQLIRSVTSLAHCLFERSAISNDLVVMRPSQRPPSGQTLENVEFLDDPEHQSSAP